MSHAGDLKAELVAFAGSDRFFAEWRAFDTGSTVLDESTITLAIDAFILQHPLAHGGTIVERFVTEWRPSLSLSDRAMMLGWRDVIEGVFEIVRHDAALHVHNLIDDLTYEVHATAGPAALKPLKAGMFLLARIVPLGHGADVWLLSGNPSFLPASARTAIAEAALEQVTAHPEALRRNPTLRQKAWEAQRVQRDEFVALFGSDVVVLPPARAQEALRTHYQRLREAAHVPRDGSRAREVDLSELSALPEDLLEADTIGLIFDEEDGLGYYRDFGRVDAFVEDPGSAGATGAAALREYLKDDSIAPSVIHHLIRRHPRTADEAFRAALGQPGFSWARDGAKLLRRYKRNYAGREPTPTVSVIGDRLTELLRPEAEHRRARSSKRRVT